MKNEELIRAYFARLHLEVPEKVTPDAETLLRLHRRHVLTIPYENTDYLTGRIRSTDVGTQFREVILGKRGGMCIDMNPLFGELLTALGFRVSLYPTRICIRKPDDLNFHIISIVEDGDGRSWWCDVANPFTRFFEPLPLIVGEELCASGSCFRFSQDADGRFVLAEKLTDSWKNLLAVIDGDAGEAGRNASKFSALRDYPDNAVCFKEVFSMVTPEGRRTLVGNLYRESVPGGFYQYECSPALMPWAYAQFGLRKEPTTAEEMNG